MQSPISLLVGPRHRDLNGFTVNRVWPTPRRRLIGPWIFFDHLLPRRLAGGEGLDVPPHPHIGLATVTYLFAGEIEHRDSTGVHQVIRPGDLNWMSAGAGIVHSERTTPAARAAGGELHALQLWVALPTEQEQAAPQFRHYPGASLPTVAGDGSRLRLLAGAAFGAVSPVTVPLPLFLAEVRLEPKGQCCLPQSLGQRAVYVITGSIAVAGQHIQSGRMIVFEDAAEVCIQAHEPALLMSLGGAPLGSERHIWWNFVASDPAAITAARARWTDREFPPVPGDSGYMPAPAV